MMCPLCEPGTEQVWPARSRTEDRTTTIRDTVRAPRGVLNLSKARVMEAVCPKYS